MASLQVALETWSSQWQTTAAITKNTWPSVLYSNKVFLQFSTYLQYMRTRTYVDVHIHLIQIWVVRSIDTVHMSYTYINRYNRYTCLVVMKYIICIYSIYIYIRIYMYTCMMYHGVTCRVSCTIWMGCSQTSRSPAWSETPGFVSQGQDC